MPIIFMLCSWKQLAFQITEISLQHLIYVCLHIIPLWSHNADKDKYTSLFWYGNVSLAENPFTTSKRHEQFNSFYFTRICIPAARMSCTSDRHIVDFCLSSKIDKRGVQREIFRVCVKICMTANWQILILEWLDAAIPPLHVHTYTLRVSYCKNCCRLTSAATHDWLLHGVSLRPEVSFCKFVYYVIWLEQSLILWMFNISKYLISVKSHFHGWLLNDNETIFISVHFTSRITLAMSNVNRPLKVSRNVN